jgi:hypothetical protein
VVMVSKDFRSVGAGWVGVQIVISAKPIKNTHMVRLNAAVPLMVSSSRLTTEEATDMKHARQRTAS